MSKAQAAAPTPEPIRIALVHRWRTIAAAPLLYAMVVPLVVLDLCLELYHRLVFPLLRIATVRRGQYIRLDRHRLPYLTPVQKLACAYCGYANGLLQYAARIAGDTEAHFCPIRHQKTPGFHEPPHHAGFAAYGDAEGLRRRWGIWIKQPAPRRPEPLKPTVNPTHKEATP